MIIDDYIDIEDLKLELDAGLEIDEEIVIYHPFDDLHKFTYASINIYREKTQKRQRMEDTELEDPFKYE